jgi:hypothetical protein
MKVLSVRAPWWWWIIYGGKDIENRDWRYAPTYQGPVLIHASSWWSKSGFDVDWEAARAMERASGKPMVGSGIWSPDKIRSLGGHIVGMVNMTDAVWKSDSPWFVGRLGLVFKDPRPLAKPIPFKAQLGLFDAPHDVLAAIKQAA